MVMHLWSPLRRLWRAAFESSALVAPGHGMTAHGATWSTGLRAASAASLPAPRYPLHVAPVILRSPASRPVRSQPSALRQPVQPLTPFRVAAAGSAGPARGPRRQARPFWMTLDPRDRRRAAIGGSFAEVCAALERLAAAEEGLRH